ncbi:MAG: hypothetical protein AABW83_03385 [Nanoarchaeota archaeon]
MSDIFNIKNIKAFILSIVIAIVLSSFVIYLVESFHPNPKWEDYCGEIRYPKTVSDKGVPENITQEICEKNEGAKWMNGYCDYEYTCRQNHENASEKHRFIVFLVVVPVGLVAVSLGIFLALPSVSSGLMLGGVFLTIYGTSNYWDKFSNWIKVLILGVVLVVLIWLGYKKLEK